MNREMNRVRQKPEYCRAVLVTLLSFLFFSGCLSKPQEEKFYYTLGYDEANEQAELMQREPIEARLWVRSANISRTYKRKQIVVRHFGPRISYLEHHLWANELEDKIPELISTRLQNYNLFRMIQQDFPYTRPEYELLPTIIAIEFRRDGGTARAALHMRFDLRSLEGISLVQTEIKREIPVYDDSLDSFVQVVNNAILDYSNTFAKDILTHFGRREDRRDTDPLRREKVEGEEEFGQLLMPELFKGEEQPIYTVIGQGGEEWVGNLGNPLTLPSGNYTVRYGSGGINRKMTRKVQIREGHKNILEPDYGGLRVEIITPEGRPVGMPYEIFDENTGTSYGTGYSGGAMARWEEQAWVLPVGRYKVTINNRPFTTTMDYSSAYVEKGKGNILTLSVSRVENIEEYRLVGGGVIKEPLYTERDENWILASSLSGNVAGTFSNQENFSTYTSGYHLNGYIQNRLRYERDLIDFSLLNSIEVGALRSETGTFEAIRDAVELDSTLIITLLHRLGLYGNFDVSSHFLDSYYRRDSLFNYEKLDKEGDIIDEGSDSDSVKTASPLSPVLLQEGIGLNLSMAKRPRFTAGGRMGLGLRQNIYGDSFPAIDSSSDPVVFQQKEDEYSTGIESSLQLSTEVFRNFIYTSRFDAYAPFTNMEEVSLEWFHELQLAFMRNFSIDYRATFYSDTASGNTGSISSDQAIYFSFSTIYRLSF